MQRWALESLHPNGKRQVYYCIFDIFVDSSKLLFKFVRTIIQFYPRKKSHFNDSNNFFSAQLHVIEWNGLEAWRNSKEETQIPRFLLEVLDGKSTIVYNLSFGAHTLCMNYVTKTFLLVYSSERTKILFCVVRGHSRPKKGTKTYNKELFRLHNHSCSPLLTMLSNCKL